MVSCGDDNNVNNPLPAGPTMTGKWMGTANYISLASLILKLDLQEVGGSIVNNPLTLSEGNCTATVSTIVGAQTPVPLGVTGSNSNSAISLTFQQPVGDLTYTGTLSSDGKKVTGKIHIKNFSSIPDTDLDMILTKQ